MEEKWKLTIGTGPLWSLGIVIGVVLCILQGVGVINIGWFWATFAFWIVPAIDVAFIIACVTIALIVAALDRP